MSRDYLIIMVYCLVCEHYQAVIAQHPIRRRGFAPALTDEEVITIERRPPLQIDNLVTT